MKLLVPIILWIYNIQRFVHCLDVIEKLGLFHEAYKDHHITDIFWAVPSIQPELDVNIDSVRRLHVKSQGIKN